MSLKSESIQSKLTIIFGSLQLDLILKKRWQSLVSLPTINIYFQLSTDMPKKFVHSDSLIIQLSGVNVIELSEIFICLKTVRNCVFSQAINLW